MIISPVIELFLRDLDRLKTEIEAYDDESKLWKVSNEINNSAGNLALHLVGNLNHFIGYAIGKTTYTRKRGLEFSSKNIPKQQLLLQIEETKEVVETVLTNLKEEDLNKQFPIRVFDREHSVFHFILHLSTHLNYHLGQINYHRRLL